MSEDFYHDDPPEEIPKKSLRSKFLTTGVVVVGTILFLQTTLAGNITLNSGRSVEFGQSVSQAVACSGSTSLTLTPNSNFTNGAGSSGSHYFSSVTVSNIPDSCFGADFSISAFNNSSSSPLPLFNTTSTAAVVHDDGGNFIAGVGGTGLSVTSGAGRFTITFTSPVALATSVFKLTLQSGVHKFCYEVGNCAVGERGPGGGIVFYASANYFTSAGSTCAAKCKYLEAAPGNWAGWYGWDDYVSDPQVTYSTNETSFTGQNVTYSLFFDNNYEGYFMNELVNWRIGKGFYNTSLMAVSGATSSAKNAALSYAGNDASSGQWFVPSTNELNELCKYARGQTTGDPKVMCTTSGTLKSTSIFGEVYGGFVADSQYWYWSSSEDQNAAFAWIQPFTGSNFSNTQKNTGKFLRPIRAF